MRTDTLTRTIEKSSEPTTSAAYRIDEKNIVHITQVLRNMYARPDLAVFREYSTNAIDAHTQAGVTKPFLVHVPTVEEPYLSLRDFGGGLDLDQTQDLLYGFGSSGEHKRTSNDQIGGFGIGCKCAFAITDAFTYTIWHGGLVRIWNCHLDEHDMGRADLLHEAPSGEEPGIEVKVPFIVRPNDESKYLSLLDETFLFIDQAKRPKLVNSDYKIPPAPKVLLSLTLPGEVNGRKVQIEAQLINAGLLPTSLQGLQGNPVLVLGGTPYAIKRDELNIQLPDGLDWHEQRVRNNLLQNIVIQAPIGLVIPAPNREGLQYSGAAKKLLNALFTALATDDAMAEMTSKLKVATNKIADRLRVHQTLGLPLVGDPWVNSSGFRIPTTLTYSKSVFRVNVSRLTYYSRRSYVNKPLWAVTENYESVSPTSNSKHTFYPLACGGNTAPILVLLPDPTADKAETLRLLAARAVTEAIKQENSGPDGSYDVYFVPEDLVTDAPWIEDGSVLAFTEDGLPDEIADDVTLLSQEAWRRKNGGNSGRSRSSGSGNKYVQTARKFVRLGTKSDNRVKSQNWVACKAADVKDGVYVKIEEFNIFGPGDSMSLTRGDASIFSKWQRLFNSDTAGGNVFVIEARKALEKVLPRAGTLLGVKTPDLESVEKDPDFVTLWKYLHDRFSEDVAANKINADAFFYTLYSWSMTWARNSTQREHLTRLLGTFLSLGADPALKGTALQKQLAWWPKAKAKVRAGSESEAWGILIAQLSSRCLTPTSSWPVYELGALVHEFSPDGLLPWKLLAAKSADARHLENSRRVPSLASGGDRGFRPLGDLMFLVDNCPELAISFGLLHLLENTGTMEGEWLLNNGNSATVAYKGSVDVLTPQLLKSRAFMKYLKATEQEALDAAAPAVV